MMSVPISRPELGDAEAEAAARVVRSGWVMQGPEVAAFERELGGAVGAAHTVAVSSGTAALELALRALNVGPGDEVATVSHSFIATANCVRAVGAKPVFVDVEPDTWGMDPASLERALGPSTRAIICAHQLGFPCDLSGILAVARGVPVIEDAACAIGSTVQLAGEAAPRRIGAPHGAIATFSFHPRKVVTTGEGGAITTADAAIADRVRRLRSHGMSLPADVRAKDPSLRERYVELGFNARMTDLAAAVGRPQLARLDAIVDERRGIAARWDEALTSHPVLAPPRERAGARGNYQSYPAVVRAGSGWDAERVLAFLLGQGISARRGIVNAHEEPAYADPSTCRSMPLPVSEHLARTTVLLPLFHGMRADEQRRVLDALSALA